MWEVGFFFNDPATTEIYTLSLRDALPILTAAEVGAALFHLALVAARPGGYESQVEDRKSTRLNSSHANISYAVFCLKKNNTRVDAYLAPTIDLPITAGLIKRALVPAAPPP